MIYFAFPGSIYALFIFYLAVMSLQRARDAGKLTRPVYYLSLPILYVGLLIDFLVNTLTASVLFLELPKEWNVSARVKRHFFESTGWRHVLAVWIAVSLLNPFDPSGAHVGMIEK
jgi:hypothetical protein